MRCIKIHAKRKIHSIECFYYLKKKKKDFKLIEATEVKPRVNKKDLPDPGIELGSPALQVGVFTS